MKFIISIFIIIWLLIVGLLTLLASFSLVLLSSSTTVNGLTIADAVTTCIFYNTQSLTFVNGLRITIPFILVTLIGVLLISIANLVSIINRQDSPSPISTIISINLLIILFMTTIGLTLSSRLEVIGNQLLAFNGVNAINACTARGFIEPNIIAEIILDSIVPVRITITGITFVLLSLTLLLYRQRPSVIELNQYFDTTGQCTYCKLIPAQGLSTQGNGCMWCHANWMINYLEPEQTDDTNTNEVNIVLNLHHAQGMPLIRPQLSIHPNDNFRVRDVMSQINNEDTSWKRIETSGNEWIGSLDTILSGGAMDTSGNVVISLEKRGFMRRREVDLTVKVRPDNSQQWSQPVSIKQTLR